MDGFTKNNSGVLILGATNVPWAIDPAFRRPGRFDRLLFVPPPDAAARIRILELMLEQRPSDERIDLSVFSKDTSGFSGADLANLIESAVDEAIAESIDQGEEVPCVPSICAKLYKRCAPPLRNGSPPRATMRATPTKAANTTKSYIFSIVGRERRSADMASAAYHIEDEPRPGALSHLVVDPLWPLFG